MQDHIKGKVVAITGASSGIGEALAKMLSANGAYVVMGARREAQLEKVRREIEEAGGKATYALVDVRNRQDLEQLVKIAVDTYGRLDVFVNNAGVAQLSRIDDLDVDGWEEMIDINLMGVLYGMAAAIPVFKQQNAGHIINIISTSGIKIVPMQGVYAGTKNAVRTIAETFRQESNGDIRITGISPGFVKTELAAGIKNPEMQSAIHEHMDKMAISPDAIAGAVIFAINQPKEVEIGDIVIRPAVQN